MFKKPQDARSVATMSSLMTNLRLATRDASRMSDRTLHNRGMIYFNFRMIFFYVNLLE